MRGEEAGDAKIVKDFADLYWKHRAPWTQTTFLGHHIAKDPFDLWVYQEVIWETRPDLIIETGTNAGGSALWFAHLLDMIGHGAVFTMESMEYEHLWPQHPRIVYHRGDSLSDQAHEIACELIRILGKRVMLSLDSLHTYEHVSKELTRWSPLVAPGCYAVVEDTVVDEAWGHPGAAAAARDFLAKHSEFEADRSREHHLFTLFPGGWLRRKV